MKTPPSLRNFSPYPPPTPLVFNSGSPVSSEQTVTKFTVKNLKIENEAKDTPSPYQNIYNWLTPHSSPLYWRHFIVSSSFKTSRQSGQTSTKFLNYIKTNFWQNKMTHQKIQTKFQKIKTNTLHRKAIKLNPSPSLHFLKWVTMKLPMKTCLLQKKSTLILLCIPRLPSHVFQYQQPAI